MLSPELPQDLIRATQERMAALRNVPESTYRVQFHADFTFANATDIVPYLHDLGVTHLYASPILKARPGSTHGYDVIDPQTLNPELGSKQDFERLSAALRGHGMGLILDTVPNHMGVATNDNAWWNDVLENGPAAEHGRWFDIAWRGSPRPQLHDKVLLPVLGEPYGQVLEKGQLKLTRDRGALAVSYYERRFPITPRTYGHVLFHRLEELRRQMAWDDPELLDFERIPRHHSAAEVRGRLAALLERSAKVREFVDQNIAIYNGVAGDPRSFDLLDALLDRQFYRLAYWRTAPDEINYRRFFDINDLAALCMERADTFQATHGLTLKMLAEGTLSGLRVDHPDGLYDPEQYFHRLQRAYVLMVARGLVESDERFAGMSWDEIAPALSDALDADGMEERRAESGLPLYVVAEKILAVDEPLLSDWPIDGTSGYDFLNEVNGLFVDPAAAGFFTHRYSDWVRNDAGFSEIAYQNKRLILRISLASELQMLAHQLDRLAQRSRSSRDFTLNGLREGLREVIACFPVYRSYICDAAVQEFDIRYVESAVREAAERNPAIDPSIFKFIQDALLQKWPDTFTEVDRAAQLHFAGKFQQVSAPVTAKGVEDTAFYAYTRFISLNEVGGDPARFGVAPAALHRWLGERQAQWAHALSPLSTHDTKRSEDVRARLNVLSEIPDEWWQRVVRWARVNEPHKRTADGIIAPDANEEYLLYQTLLGAWPLGTMSADEQKSFTARIHAYMEKALREAKIHTSWTRPNTEYEKAVKDFVSLILDEGQSNLFLQDFRAFARRVSHYGLLNSLSQTILRLSAPGAPDTYQGTELWDFSLVDPDNRRPVDYPLRRRLLGSRDQSGATRQADGLQQAKELLAFKEDGRIKLFVTQALLTCRRQNPGLFTDGDYVPLAVSGPRAEHVFAFMRRKGEKLAIVAIPRFLTRVTPATSLPLGAQAWQDTKLHLPPGVLGSTFVSLLTGESIAPTEANNTLSIPLSQLFADLPAAVCIRNCVLP